MPQARDNRIPSGTIGGIPPQAPSQPVGATRLQETGTSSAAGHGAWWGFSLCQVSLLNCVIIAFNYGDARSGKGLWILPGFCNSVLAFTHQHALLLAIVALAGLVVEIVILTHVYQAKKETGGLPTILVILIFLANIAAALLAMVLSLCLMGLALKVMFSNSS